MDENTRKRLGPTAARSIAGEKVTAHLEELVASRGGTLHRGGKRQANPALHIAAGVRMRY